MKILEEERGSIKMLLERFDQGYANALVEKLLESKDITFASALYDHPTKRNPVVTVKGKNLKKEINSAISSLEDETHAFEEKLRKQ
ncbi:hypothetical protein HZC09_06365 [Candidatus Micrarchaeota archaeon]|nr:hypothetical protein [Candidatus Micrarchaeota archaeon]